MSAAILQNPRKVHDFCDDRESAFHVLTWTALCYGHHDQTLRVGRYLRQYDDFYSAGRDVEGGELKINALMQYVLSEEVTFNPPFNRLITDLTAHLRARYVKIDPSDRSDLAFLTQNIAELERAPVGSKSQLEMAQRYRDTNFAYKVSVNLERLQTRNWLIETMRKHLAEPDWPLNDAARPRGLHLDCNSKKRPRDEEDSPIEGPSRSKVEKWVAYLDVSSSRVPFACSGSSRLGGVMEVDDEDL